MVANAGTRRRTDVRFNPVPELAPSTVGEPLGFRLRAFLRAVVDEIDLAGLHQSVLVFFLQLQRVCDSLELACRQWTAVCHLVLTGHDVGKSHDVCPFASVDAIQSKSFERCTISHLAMTISTLTNHKLCARGIRESIRALAVFRV